MDNATDRDAEADRVRRRANYRQAIYSVYSNSAIIGAPSPTVDEMIDAVTKVADAESAEKDREIKLARDCWAVDMRQAHERGEAIARVHALADEWEAAADAYEDANPRNAHTMRNLARELRAAMHVPTEDGGR